MYYIIYSPNLQYTSGNWCCSYVTCSYISALGSLLEQIDDQECYGKEYNWVMNEFISLEATVHVGDKIASEVYKKIEAAYDRDLEVSPHSYYYCY